MSCFTAQEVQLPAFSSALEEEGLKAATGRSVTSTVMTVARSACSACSACGLTAGTMEGMDVSRRPVRVYKGVDSGEARATTAFHAPES